MKLFKSQIGILTVLAFLSLNGCGGSGTNGTVADPLASNQQGTGTSSPPTGSGTVLNYSLSLSAVGSSGDTTVGPNSTVIATATLKDNNGNLVANQPIKFEEILTAPGDASSVTIPVPIVTTSSGVATTFIQTANTNTNKDVIIKASTSINGQEISSISIFKIVRSAGNYINFISTKNTTDPDGNLNELTVEITAIDPQATPTYNILQLVTLDVLDKNDNKRTSVPVKLEIFNILGECTLSIGSPLAQTQTVTTDDTGLSVFSAYATLTTPPIGSENSCAVIYKATTPDPYSDTQQDLNSYGAYIVNLKNIKP